MSKEQAEKRAEVLNATRYRLSAIRVEPMRYGTVWVLVGVAK